MFRKWKGFLAGAFFMLILMMAIGGVFGAATGTNIKVYYNPIKIMANGKEILFKDAKGNEIAPFYYDGMIYAPLRGVAEAFDKVVDWQEKSKKVQIYDTEMDKIWDNLIDIAENQKESDFYWRHIDDEVIETGNRLVAEHGADALFRGLASPNRYSRYYCIHRLIEYYNDEAIRPVAIEKITPFLNSPNPKIKDGASFALAVLTKKFDHPAILHVDKERKLFSMFPDYTDYGSYPELWMIKDDRLTKFSSFSYPQVYIDITEKIQVSLDCNKIAVQTCSRRSSSINVIDLASGEVGPELMQLAIEKVFEDHKDYKNTYPDGRYSWSGNLKWLDNHRITFEASLSYNFTDIIEKVSVEYDVLNHTMSYVKK